MNHTRRTGNGKADDRGISFASLARRTFFDSQLTRYAGFTSTLAIVSCFVATTSGALAKSAAPPHRQRRDSLVRRGRFQGAFPAASARICNTRLGTMISLHIVPAMKLAFKRPDARLHAVELFDQLFV